MGMYEEIMGSQTSWRQALAKASAWPYPSWKGLLFLGSGSSYHLAQLGAHLARLRGEAAWALPSGEVALTPRFPPLEGVVGISRSGQTTELGWAKEVLGVPGLLLTTNPEAPLGAVFERTIVLEEAQETSIVQTRSFSSTLVLLLKAADPGLDLLPPYPEPGWLAEVQAWPQGARYFLLGTGLGYPVAQEGALKLKETALVWAEAFHTLEFRHGPMSQVDGETVLLAFLSGHPQEARVVEEMEGLGARVVRLPYTPATLAQALARVQLFAYLLAKERDLDPDHPRHLRYAVEL